MFSSITSNSGIAGQTNYGYANFAMKSICENRRRDGLHGLAIEWGHIDEVDYIARNMDIEYINKVDYKLQTVSSILNVLDKLMQIEKNILRKNSRCQRNYS